MDRSGEIVQIIDFASYLSFLPEPSNRETGSRILRLRVRSARARAPSSLSLGIDSCLHRYRNIVFFFLALSLVHRRTLPRDTKRRGSVPSIGVGLEHESKLFSDRKKAHCRPIVKHTHDRDTPPCYVTAIHDRSRE